MMSSPIDFSLRVDTEFNFLGPMVCVHRTCMDGTIQEEYLPAALAVMDVLTNPKNGISYRSARIYWQGVYDEWSASL